jgi:signal transduction histidine kinase/ActR/RegA family two-component response regulator
MADVIARIARRLTVTPLVAVFVAAGLLIVSLGLALYNEHMGRLQYARAVGVQAEILAASVAAPLAFDDGQATREYVNALRANPAVEAVAAYDQQGQVAAEFHRDALAAPRSAEIGAPRWEGGKLVVTHPVMQGSTHLGAVYLRYATETPQRRAMRYLGIGVVVVMASLMVAVLGASQANMREANARLEAEIRERERAEEALRQAQKMEAMGQLTGGVAHDFNNLLMVASSGLDLLDRTSDPARRERLKQGIRQAIDRGASLTQQLLAFARKTPLKTEIVDLGAQLKSMSDVLERSLREDITVSIEAAPDLWPVEIDPAQFEVAILNMALNARDAMPQGGSIHVRAENQSDPDQARDSVRLTVTDTGQGIPPERLSRVFEPFFTTKGVGAGTGLGLSQVYGFARASGGEVSIQREVGRGTSVVLLIPRSHRPAAPVQATQAPSIDSESRHCRVLLVEDDDRVAELVADMLGELGYDVVRTANAAMAMDVLQRGESVDLVFSDMVMPGEMDGLELARDISRRKPELPVVLTTGYSASASAAAQEGLRLLVKPYRIEALAAELAAAMEARAA